MKHYMLNTRFYKVLILACFINLIPVIVPAQQNTAYDIMVPPERGVRCRAEVLNGDTVPVVDLYPVDIETQFVFRNPKHYEQWTRVKYNVKKVYPYAILAAAKLKEYDKALASISDERLKKAFLKNCERDLRNEFEEELKNLSVSQGKVLMKLIDRESGKTTYEIVKQLRGSFQAAMWNALATLFGNNMKCEYDAATEDIFIERAVKLVERGDF